MFHTNEIFHANKLHDILNPKHYGYKLLEELYFTMNTVLI